MASLSAAVRTLEDRRTTIEAEIAKIDKQLRAITTALGAASRATKPITARASAKSSAPATKKRSRKGSRTGKWFKPGEAVELMKKLAAKPVRPGELIRALAGAKGYAGKLAKPQMDRFTWAATSAIKAAVNAKHLVRSKDGALTAR